MGAAAGGVGAVAGLAGCGMGAAASAATGLCGLVSLGLGWRLLPTPMRPVADWLSGGAPSAGDGSLG